MKQTTIAVMLMVVSLLMSGCETMETVTKEEIGTAGGAIAGAWIGNRVGGDNKALATTIGALSGAFIGKAIGRMLDEQDRQRLAQSTYDTMRTGQPQSWHNADTGVSVKTTVKQSTTQQQQVEVKVLKDKIKEVPPLELIGEEYSSKGTINVRGGPGTDYVIVGKLSAGEHINVVGKVTGKSWYMISRGGIGSGFVHADLLSAVPMQNWSVADTEIPVSNNEVQTTVVTATRDCRVVSQEVTLDNGQTATEDVTACRGPNGWEIV